MLLISLNRKINYRVMTLVRLVVGKFIVGRVDNDNQVDEDPEDKG